MKFGMYTNYPVVGAPFKAPGPEAATSLDDRKLLVFRGLRPYGSCRHNLGMTRHTVFDDRRTTRAIGIAAGAGLGGDCIGSPAGDSSGRGQLTESASGILLSWIECSGKPSFTPITTRHCGSAEAQ